MNKKCISALAVLLTILIVATLAACKNDPQSMVDKVTLDVTQAAVVVGDTFTVVPTVNPSDAPDKSVTFTSDNIEVLTVDNDGKCTALAVGEATVTATTKKGAKTAECKILIGDYIVKAAAATTGDMSEEESDEQHKAAQILVGGEAGTTLFETIAQAVSASNADKTIIVVESDYGEAVTANSSVTIIGLGTVSLKSFLCNGSNATIKLNNLLFKNTSYPVGGSASIVIPDNASADITDCVFYIDSTEELAGGYAILIGKQAQKINIDDCTISNYRYGIYVNPTDQEINIRNNTFSNLKFGIGVDIRQENSDPPANYPTKGRVGGNEYNEVENNTQFFHYGETYDGDFDFSDFDDQSEVDDGLDITD